jgi:hypothetical protein
MGVDSTAADVDSRGVPTPASVDASGPSGRFKDKTTTSPGLISVPLAQAKLKTAASAMRYPVMV